MQTKICNNCRVEKETSEFHPNKSCKLGVIGTCRKCSAERINTWYGDNRTRRQALANSKNQRRKQEVVQHFGDKCFDCSQTFPQYVYQFHHLDPIKKDVNPSYAMTKRPTEMWKELEKCVMLCANCHMIRHFRKEGVDATIH